MTWTVERLRRTSIGGGLAVIAALVMVANYHPCDGIGFLMILPFVCAGIAIMASLPTIMPRNLLLPGLITATVFAIAFGINYVTSGPVSSSTEQCEPVAGAAGFLLAAVWTGVLSLIGLGMAMLVTRGASRVFHRHSPEGESAEMEHNRG